MNEWVKLREKIEYLKSVAGLERPCREYRITVDGICKGAMIYVFYDHPSDRYGAEVNVLMFKPDSKEPFEEWASVPIMEAGEPSVKAVVEKTIGAMIDYYDKGYTHIVYTKGIYQWQDPANHLY